MQRKTIILLWLLLLVLAGCSDHSIHPQPAGDIQFASTTTSSNTTSLTRDVQGYLWVGTDKGVDIFDGTNFRQLVHHTNDAESLPSDMVNMVYRDPTDTMWVATGNGVACYLGNGRFRSFPSSAPHRYASSVIKTRSGQVLAVFGNHLCRLRTDSFVTIAQLGVASSPLEPSAIYESGNGRVMVAISRNIFISDASLLRFKPFFSQDDGGTCSAEDQNYVCVTSFARGTTIFSKRDFSVVDNYKPIDPLVPEKVFLYNNKLYMTTHDGTYSLDRRLGQFVADTTLLNRDDDYRFLTCTFVDKDNTLWGGFLHKGFRAIQPDAVTPMCEMAAKLNPLFGEAGLINLTCDMKGNLAGALVDDRLFFYHGQSHQAQLFSISDYSGIHSKQHVQNIILAHGYLWVVTTSSIYALAYGDGLRLTQFYDPGLAHRSLCGNATATDRGIAVLLDDNQLLNINAYQLHPSTTSYVYNSKWKVAYSSGPMTITVKRMKGCHAEMTDNILNAGAGNVIISDEHGESELVALSTGRSIKAKVIGKDEHIRCTMVDGHHVYLGTDKGLYLWHSDINQTDILAGTEGLSVDGIVIKDSKLYFSAAGQLMAYDMSRHKPSTVWAGSKASSFQQGSLCVANNLLLAINSQHRLQTFNVDVKGRKQQPRLIVEDLLVSNGMEKPTRCEFWKQDGNIRVQLRHDENNIAILFAAIGERLSGDYIYHYRLEGYDDHWRECVGSKNVEYMKLDPGHYTFVVRCTDQTHPWLTAQRQIAIVVHPHPLASVWAIVFYLLAAAAITFYLYRLLFRMRMERVKAETAERGKEQERYINQMNMSFFANISQEFRNPIAMIAGPIRVLANAKDLSKAQANMVRLISQSASILTKLVDQLLDFNRLDSDALKLEVSRKDVTQIVSDLAHHFDITAKEKDITVSFSGLGEPIYMLVDEDKVSKITDNLMVNALSHTPQGGTIDISLGQEGDLLRLTVENSGEQIPASAMPHIFDRYYLSYGSGIGLYYIRRLAQLHHGAVAAENIDHGVRFIVTLPTNEEAYTAEERKPGQQEMLRQLTDDDIIRSHRDETTAIAPDDERRRLLIIDNDVNMSYFLRKFFEDEFIVTNRYDVDTAEEALDQIQPDVIIMETTFTGKSGFDFCRQLRASSAWSSVPVIFLTGQNADEAKAEGIRAGANYYITKPFSPDYLREVVMAEAEHGQQLRLAAKHEPSQPKEQKTISKRDEQLLSDIYHFMDDHILEGHIDVTALSRKVLIGRSKVYEKIKELTGCTPNDLFRIYKLNKAAELLRDGNYNVSEVAERTGFSSIAYFSRTFKQHFGVSPKDYS